MPARFRRDLGIEEGSFVEIVLEGDGPWLSPVQIVGSSEGAPGWAGETGEEDFRLSLAEATAALDEEQRRGRS